MSWRQGLSKWNEQQIGSQDVTMTGNLDRKSESTTNIRTDGVGAKDACVSKKYQEEIYCSRLENLYCNRLSLQLMEVIWNKSHRLQTDGRTRVGARNACAFKSACILLKVLWSLKGKV